MVSSYCRITTFLVLLFTTSIVADYSAAHSMGEELFERSMNIARFKDYEEHFPIPSAIETFEGCDRAEVFGRYHCMEIAIEPQPCGMSGGCPSYHLHLYGDGRVEFSGRRSKNIVGDKMGRLNAYNTQIIFKFLLENIDTFADMEERYTLPVLGANDVLTLLKLGPNQKTISTHESAGPIELLVLQQLVDGVLLNVEWE